MLSYTLPDRALASNNKHTYSKNSYVLVKENNGCFVLKANGLFLEETGYKYMYYAYHDIETAQNANLSSNSIENLDSYHALVYTNNI